MTSFLFWNLAKNEETIPCVNRIVATHSIDILFLAECPVNPHTIVLAPRENESNRYRVADRGINTKVRGISRLAESKFFPRFNNQNGDMTIWGLDCSESGNNQIQVATVHLLSKVGGAGPPDQQAAAEAIYREIVEYEDREECADTIVVGDFNMNPYEEGMVIVSAFQAAMTKRIAGSAERIWRKQKYRRFYNPMWGLFGDRTPGPAGTHYWDSSVTSNHQWHVFDQVLLRPSLMNQLCRMEILDNDGINSLLDRNGRATKEYLSDHLPIIFELDV